jgi:putative two-component system response regulator
MSSAGHEVVTAVDGQDALEKARKDSFDLVVTDILMPRMDGYRLSMEFRSDPALAKTPFIFYTASYTDPEDEDFANRLGAACFVRKPVEPADLLAVVRETLAETGHDDSIAQHLDIADQRDLLSRYSDRLVQKLEDKVEELQHTLDGAIGAMIHVVEIRDPYTAGHQQRVSYLATAVAERLDFAADVVCAIRTAGLLHDIGKLSVPAEILSKPGRLTAAEFEIIKSHPLTSENILSSIDFPWPVAAIARQHHERLDGSGYPDGLAGDDITLEARIIAVADVVEAMSSHRPYRPAHTLETALTHVQEASGTRYDPEAIDACAELIAEGAVTLDPPPLPVL